MTLSSQTHDAVVAIRDDHLYPALWHMPEDLCPVLGTLSSAQAGPSTLRDPFLGVVCARSTQAVVLKEWMDLPMIGMAHWRSLVPLPRPWRVDLV